MKIKWYVFRHASDDDTRPTLAVENRSWSYLPDGSVQEYSILGIKWHDTSQNWVCVGEEDI